MNYLLRIVLACALVALMPLDSASAQSEGKILGTVRDSSGAGIPGATVTATNQSTKVSMTATTGNDGSYASAVPPGSYIVAVDAPAFRRFTQVVVVAGLNTETRGHGGSSSSPATVACQRAHAGTAGGPRRAGGPPARCRN
jgi:hypothetical protein